MSAVDQSALSRTDAVLAPRSLANTGSVIPDWAANLDASKPVSKLQEQPSNGKEIAEFIVHEMLINEQSQAAKEIVEKLSQFRATEANKTLAPAQRLLSLYQAAKMFAAKVGYGMSWDHKEQIRTRWGKYALLFGISIQYDVWSNIHYGFIGIRVGFNAEFLRRAAGYAQLVSSRVPDDWLEKVIGRDVPLLEALDDAVDQGAINVGIQLGLPKDEPTVDSLLKVMRANIGKLTS